MSCVDPPPVQEPSNQPVPAPRYQNCLIGTPEQARALNLSANRETDARTALKRGLANYLMSLPAFIHPSHQRTVVLQKIYDVWPDQEEKTVYPSAAVHSKTDHDYEASGFTPALDPACKVDANTYLIKYSEVGVTLTIDILTTDPEERICFGMQMEDALNPVDWMYGFQLELPHYHNLRGVYELTTGNYPDDEPSVFSRNRHLTYTLRGQVPMVRLSKLTPLTEVRMQGEQGSPEITVVDGNTDC